MGCVGWQGVWHIPITPEYPEWGVHCATVPGAQVVQDVAPTCLLCIGIAEILVRAGIVFLVAYNRKVGDR